MTSNSPSLPASSDPSRDTEIQRYLRVLRKRIWIIAAVVAVGVTAVTLYTLRRPRIYQATASVVVDPTPPQVLGSKMQEVVQLGAQNYWSNQDYYNTQLDILASFELAQITVVKNNLWENPKLLPPRENDTRTKDELIAAATQALFATLAASQNRDSWIVNVHVRHTDRELAIELANRHVESYLGYTLGLRTGGSGKAAQFLAAEVDQAQARLKTTEEAVLAFKEKNGLLSVSLEDKQSILAKDIQAYSDALTATRVKRMELASIRERVRNLSKEKLLESPLFALTSASDTIGLLKAEYVREKQQLLALEEELGPKHPAYTAQLRKVEDMYQSIQHEADVVIAQMDERNKALLANEGQFSGQLEVLKKEAFELGPKAVEYNRLVRQQQSDEANYNLVIERLRASELSRDNQEINVRPHSMARDTKLVSPRVRLNIALGFMLSLILGIGLGFLLEYVDRTVRTAEDIEAVSGAPFLGIIPLVEEVSDATSDEAVRDRDLYVSKHPTSRAAECCRSIRTNILFSSADRRMKTLTISSPRPREGKTTSTIYLGTTMAQSGQRVLLIDTDLRRPRLHRSLGVSGTHGLTNVLLGDVGIDDVIKTTDIPNLFVLPCGPHPPNPAELLLTKRFHDVLRDLEERFDRILLDSPPLLAVTDGTVLARLSDGVVLIAKAQKTVTEDVRLSTRQLRDIDAPILGVILNEMDISDRRYGYSYYQYGYGDKVAAPETEPSS